MSAERRIVLTLDLTRGEQALLDRTLRGYAATFQRMIEPGTSPADRKYLLDRVAVTDELLRRVRPELQHPDRPENPAGARPGATPGDADAAPTSTPGAGSAGPTAA